MPCSSLSAFSRLLFLTVAALIGFPSPLHMHFTTPLLYLSIGCSLYDLWTFVLMFFFPCGPIRYRILITTLCSCFELFCIDHFCPTSKSRRVEWLWNSKSCKAVQSMWKMSGVTQIYYFRRMIFHPQVNSEDIDVWGSIKYFGQLLDKTAADNKLTVLWNIIVL